MIMRRHPALLAALMLCTLPEREPTPEEQRDRALKRFRDDLARDGVLAFEPTIKRPATTATEATGAVTFEAPRPSSPIGRTMAEVNRERRARGELGTKRQRAARRGRP